MRRLQLFLGKYCGRMTNYRKSETPRRKLRNSRMLGVILRKPMQHFRFREDLIGCEIGFAQSTISDFVGRSYIGKFISLAVGKTRQDYNATRSYCCAPRATARSATSGNGRCNALVFIPRRPHPRVLPFVGEHDHRHGLGLDRLAHRASAARTAARRSIAFEANDISVAKIAWASSRPTGWISKCFSQRPEQD